MKLGLKRFYIELFATILFLFLGTSVFAQAQPVRELLPDLLVQRRQAPMKPIFNNVLWGSVAGAVAFAGLHMVDDSKTTDNRYKISDILDQSVTGATYGGWIGLGVGIYMSLMGITFENTILSMNFSPVEEIDYHEQQRRLYGNKKITTAKGRILSVQVRF